MAAKTKQLPVRLRPDLYDKLWQISAQWQCSLSQALNRLVEEYELK